MHLSIAVRLAFVTFASTASAYSNASATGVRAPCGGAQSASERKVSLSSMRSGTLLYLMEDSGRLVTLNLRTGKSTVLSDHGFDTKPTLRPSGDGRWLSYSGVLRVADKTQYWLYDRHKQSDKLIYEHPAWGGGIPRFSPNSRFLAISAGFDSRWPNASRAGIYLLDTATMRLQAVPVPALNANRTAWTSASWSSDGKELLILVRNESAKEGFDYFSYRLATKRIEAIAGTYNRQLIRHEFRRGIREIPTAQEIVPKSDLGVLSAWSPGRNWYAKLEGRDDSLPYKLMTTSKEGVARKVATGGYSNCMGHDLYITGWLDERYLVYRKSMSYAIFDVVTGSTAELFSDEMATTFTW